MFHSVALSFPLPLFRYMYTHILWVLFFVFFFTPHSPHFFPSSFVKRSKWFVYLHWTKKKETGHHFEWNSKLKAKLCVGFRIPFEILAETIRAYNAAQKFRMFNYPYKEKESNNNHHTHDTQQFRSSSSSGSGSKTAATETNQNEIYRKIRMHCQLLNFISNDSISISISFSSLKIPHFIFYHRCASIR